ncbi:heterokaryon incompatibility protein-domain-containing protein [Lasiosphaeria miniovina]|uniref:Heterokaryon incompatibility protein-domain-containing protein n=1 Tax=Lasiosphaeria miniovina TaxID=1954250 RepID=A0AA40E2P9_9PEZI|nr:heterokaryon incompatibility protein-domain-containing protein [Lasiosphaeria miniovina]KAK0721971.1 heterokaryon incompatibility protein-domain-containing protein [Lasiosphaeria miniovina]
MSESSTYPEQIAMGPYQYWNLQEKGWVRILSIEPSRMLADPIRASLLHQSLSDLEERGYEALSYCWGKANATCAISIDGASFLVRPNLLSALRRLRRRASRGRRLVWVDAICTNQGDIAERNRQVSQMHQIFSKASRVVVWLDEGGPRTDFAVDTLQQWAAPAKQIEDRWRVRVNTTTASLQGFYDDWTLLYQSLQDRDGRPFFHTCLVEVLWLFQCDWWNRMWTMQELVLAREALVQVGSKTVPWIGAHGRGGAASVGGVYTSLVASFFNMAEDLRVLRAHRSANIPISLSFVLQYTSARLATDARDKVYAGLAIVDWEETQEALRADYNLSCREVYTSAIKTLLAESGDLRAYNFLLGTPPGGGGEFPSWVPSFAADVVRQPDLCFLGGGSRGDFMVTASKGRLYLAGATPALDMKHELRFEGRDKIMAIKGVLIDSLQSIGDAAPQDDGVTDNLEISIAGAIQQWRALVGSLDGHYPTVGPSERRESKKEAFWRTVTLDCKVVFYHAGLKLHNNPRDMRRRLNSPTDAKIPPRTPSEERELLAALDEQVRWKEGQQVGRRFFTTRRGFMGIGPPEAQAGDVVCVFLGGETPFVLRPGNGGRYKLLRQCYLHGFMMGEAIAHACHTGILRLEEIKLE